MRLALLVISIVLLVLSVLKGGVDWDATELLTLGLLAFVVAHLPFDRISRK